MTQTRTQIVSLPFAAVSYAEYAVRAQQAGVTVRANTSAAYGHVQVNLGAAGGASTVTNMMSRYACGIAGDCGMRSGCSGTHTPGSLYEAEKRVQGLTVVRVVEERCDDVVDNNGNGLVNEVCRGCSENGVKTGSTTELASGNLTQSVPLLAFDRRPTSLALAAACNSQDTAVGVLGRGWTHPYARRITADNGVTLALVDAEGGYSFYRKEGTDTYYPLTRGGTQDRVVKTASGAYERVFPDGGRWRFSAAGTLVELRDRTGRAITLSYAGALLTQARDSVGRTFTFTYDANQRLSQVTDSAGRSVSFAYDPTATYLASVVDAAGGSWDFTYDGAGRMATKRAPGGSVTAYAYDAQNRLTQVTDPRGVVKQLVYDPAQQTTRIIGAGGAPRACSDGMVD